MNVLFLDKTGTITKNELSVSDAIPFGDYKQEDISLAAAMASREEGKDQIDEAVIAYARKIAGNLNYKQSKFTPFEPVMKRSEAVVDYEGKKFRVVKGAFETVISMCKDEKEEIISEARKHMENLSAEGYRVMAVARSSEDESGKLCFMGLISFADPPRDDSKQMISEMKSQGIKVKVLTGDNVHIAKNIAQAVGIGSNVISISELRNLKSDKEQADLVEKIDGIAEIYPEDKFRIVKLMQSKGYIVGMTGDGVNDSPSLKQAEVGIAVSNATDVSKASASIVLTRPGIEAINLAIVTSRQIYQRMLTWVINKLTKVIQFIGLLTLGFLIFHDVLLTALGMVLLVVANDFSTMALARDRVKNTANPNSWNIKKMSIASLIVGSFFIVEGFITILVGKFYFNMSAGTLQSFVLMLLVFTSQFKVLIVRERKHFWNSVPGRSVIISTTVTLAVFAAMGIFGILIPAITLTEMAFALIFSLVFSLAMDIPKYFVFKRYL